MLSASCRPVTTDCDWLLPRPTFPYIPNECRRRFPLLRETEKLLRNELKRCGGGGNRIFLLIRRLLPLNSLTFPVRFGRRRCRLLHIHRSDNGGGCCSLLHGGCHLNGYWDFFSCLPNFTIQLNLRLLYLFLLHHKNNSLSADWKVNNNPFQSRHTHRIFRILLSLFFLPNW